jgi:hypothetical protein
MQPELAFDGWIAASEWAPARLMRSVRRQRHVRNRGGIRSFMLDYLVRVRGDHGERQHIDRAKADLFVLRPQMSLGKPSIPRPSQPERADTLRLCLRFQPVCNKAASTPGVRCSIRVAASHSCSSGAVGKLPWIIRAILRGSGLPSDWKERSKQYVAERLLPDDRGAPCKCCLSGWHLWRHGSCRPGQDPLLAIEA